MRPVRKADNLPISCAVVMKSGNLKLLEPSGPVQACNGTDLPFTYNPVRTLACLMKDAYSSLMFAFLFNHFTASPINHALHLSVITIWTFPLFFYLLSFYQQVFLAAIARANLTS